MVYFWNIFKGKFEIYTQNFSKYRKYTHLFNNSKNTPKLHFIHWKIHPRCLIRVSPSTPFYPPQFSRSSITPSSFTRPLPYPSRGHLPFIAFSSITSLASITALALIHQPVLYYTPIHRASVRYHISHPFTHPYNINNEH